MTECVELGAKYFRFSGMVQWPSPVRSDALRAVVFIRRRRYSGLVQRHGEYFKGI